VISNVNTAMSLQQIVPNAHILLEQIHLLVDVIKAILKMEIKILFVLIVFLIVRHVILIHHVKLVKLLFQQGKNNFYLLKIS
jgi:hypothetical protein